MRRHAALEQAREVYKRGMRRKGGGRRRARDGAAVGEDCEGDEAGAGEGVPGLGALEPALVGGVDCVEDGDELGRFG